MGNESSTPPSGSQEHKSQPEPAAEIQPTRTHAHPPEEHSDSDSTPDHRNAEAPSPRSEIVVYWTKLYLRHKPGSSSLRDTKFILRDDLHSEMVQFRVVDGLPQVFRRRKIGALEASRGTVLEELARTAVPPFQCINLIENIFSLDIAVAAGMIAELICVKLDDMLGNEQTQGLIARDSLPFGIIAIQLLRGRALAASLERLSTADSTIVAGWTIVTTDLTPTEKLKLGFHPCNKKTLLCGRHWQIFVDPTSRAFLSWFDTETDGNDTSGFEEQASLLPRLNQSIAAALFLFNEAVSYVKGSLRPAAEQEEAQQLLFDAMTEDLQRSPEEEQKLLVDLRIASLSQYLFRRRNQPKEADLPSHSPTTIRGQKYIDTMVTSEDQSLARESGKGSVQGDAAGDQIATSNNRRQDSAIESTDFPVKDGKSEESPIQRRTTGTAGRDSLHTTFARPSESTFDSEDKMSDATKGKKSLNRNSKRRQRDKAKKAKMAEEERQREESASEADRAQDPDKVLDETSDDEVLQPADSAVAASESDPTTVTDVGSTADQTHPMTMPASPSGGLNTPPARKVRVLETIEEEGEEDEETTPTKHSHTMSAKSAGQEEQDGDRTLTQSFAALSLLNPTAPIFSPPAQVFFRFDNLHPATRCRNPECRKNTHALDGSTRICPACGPRSRVRYCSRKCLYADVRRHFMNECGQEGITGPIDESSLCEDNNERRPFIRHSTEGIVNTIERHRQAVWFAMEAEGEYFVFDDVSVCQSDNPTKEEVQEVRGLGNCIYAIHVPEDVQRLFRQALVAALSFGYDRPMNRPYCEALGGLIRQALMAFGQWDEQMCTYVVMQLGFETQYQMPQD